VPKREKNKEKKIKAKRCEEIKAKKIFKEKLKSCKPHSLH
jgi:hypothetical protein